MEEGFRVKLPERFDFSYHKVFYEHTANALKQTKYSEILADFSQVEYLDSSALGMLVMLQKKCTEQNKKVVIVNASGIPFDILQVANMDKIVEIR